ncbi:neural/ectodermal development factor IMP-L2-like isoform X1 [Zerene cesonia]|uniref:neural/ectodermal development factor IMP-L2-like isoform X1 n=1 Tax=Zerene cesonia TaxID=33412 RepID=UPI0018E55914|nr:neural/ectodermal development factor IMP-L2-like isoform X1 [Zerene cesonia]XP_038217306.1 neural/ectodermal development factor IMP-L2-like isoform X1 [Zerene cesonia]
MYKVLLFAAAALLCDSRAANINRHMKILDMDNHIESNLVPRQQTKRFITLTKRPSAKLSHVAGTTLELTCEAIAAPAPSVHWFKNDAPVTEYDKESNEIIDTNPSSLGRVSSTLLVSRSGPRARYTCLVVSGPSTARASTVVYSEDGSTELSERSKLVPLAPRILVSYKVFVDIIGANVALPCRVRGHPRPALAWRDNNGKLIKNDHRMKVLRSGELVIVGLRWEDMGEFTCHASNIFGSAEIKTFVYPARPDDKDG